MEPFMPNLYALKENRNAKVDALKALAAKAETERRDLTDAEQAEFTSGRQAIERLDRDIRNAEFLAEAERRAEAEPVTPGRDTFEAEARNVAIADVLKGAVAGRVQGREREWSDEYERRTGKTPRGVWVPLANLVETRVQLKGTATAGGNIIGTTLRDDLYAGIYKPTPVVVSLGATVVDGLVGDIDVPVATGEPAVAWVGEHGAPSASDAAFAKRTGNPKTVASLTEISRRMLIQSTPAIEGILRRMVGENLALAMDRAAIRGGGSNEPTGILPTAGIGSVAIAANGGAPTMDHLADLIAVTNLASVTTATSFLTTNQVLRLAMKAKDGQNNPLGVSRFFHERPATFSNQVPANLTKGSGTNLSAIIWGDWSELMLLFWSGVDVVVNPYADSVASKGGALLHGFLDCDVIVRRPAAFAAITDAVA
jgi:HK97 family phage major capsid protein